MGALNSDSRGLPPALHLWGQCQSTVQRGQRKTLAPGSPASQWGLILFNDDDSIQILMRFISWNGYPGGSGVKTLPANAGDSGSIPGLGRPLGEGKGN